MESDCGGGRGDIRCLFLPYAHRLRPAAICSLLWLPPPSSQPFVTSGYTAKHPTSVNRNRIMHCEKHGWYSPSWQHVLRYESFHWLSFRAPIMKSFHWLDPPCLPNPCTCCEQCRTNRTVLTELLRFGGHPRGKPNLSLSGILSDCFAVRGRDSARSPTIRGRNRATINPQ